MNADEGVIGAASYREPGACSSDRGCSRTGSHAAGLRARLLSIGCALLSSSCGRSGCVDRVVGEACGIGVTPMIVVSVVFDIARRVAAGECVPVLVEWVGGEFLFAEGVLEAVGNEELSGVGSVGASLHVVGLDP